MDWLLWPICVSWPQDPLNVPGMSPTWRYSVLDCQGTEHTSQLPAPGHQPTTLGNLTLRNAGLVHDLAGCTRGPPRAALAVTAHISVAPAATPDDDVMQAQPHLSSFLIEMRCGPPALSGPGFCVLSLHSTANNKPLRGLACQVALSTFAALTRHPLMYCLRQA